MTDTTEINRRVAAKLGAKEIPELFDATPARPGRACWVLNGETYRDGSAWANNAQVALVLPIWHDKYMRLSDHLVRIYSGGDDFLISECPIINPKRRGGYVAIAICKAYLGEA